MFPIITGRRLIQIIVVWPLVFVTTTFIMFYSYNSRFAFAEDRKVPTISETGFISPESVVLTYGLHSEAVLLSLFFLAVYAVYNEKINNYVHILSWNNDEKGDVEALQPATKCLYCCCNCTTSEGPKRTFNIQLMHTWNFVTLCLGLTCCIFMSIVGSVTLAVNVYVHSFCAFAMFLTGVLHMLLFYTKIAWYLEESQRRLLAYKVLLFVCIPFNIIIAIIAGSLYLDCSTHDCQAFAVNISPVAEFWTTAALIVYCFTFLPDIECVTLGHVLNKALMAQQSNGTNFDSAVSNGGNTALNQLRHGSVASSSERSVERSSGGTASVLFQ